MVVRIDPGEEQASVLSLHRDTWVRLPGTGRSDKINAAYGLGATPEEGAQHLIDTIRENFGVPIHHYVEVSFDGFARLVDSVGGIPLWFDTAVRDRRSGFYEERLGCVTLDGQQALQFVRSRHLEYLEAGGEWEDDLTGDLGRVTRQQIFMREAAERVVGRIRSNPVAATGMVDIALDSVTIDEGIGLGDIRGLADRFQDFSTENLRTYTLPVDEAGPPRWEVNVVERDAQPVLEVFRGGEPGEISPSLVSVTVLNGSGRPGQANDVAGALQAVGFDVLPPGNVSPAGAIVPRTQVRHAPGDEAYAERVARHLTSGAELVENPALGRGSGSVEVVTGADFTTVREEPTPLAQVTTTTAPSPTSTTSSSTSSPTTSSSSSSTTTTTTAPPPTTEPPGHAVGEIPRGANCG
jgi:LCP family protein required for cell wall assembly